jgi:septum formation inhibitor MinC
VLGSVGSGEIAAGGSIHIYGTLRAARWPASTAIQCGSSQKIEAELLAIDGYYRAEEIDVSPTARRKPGCRARP